MIPPDLCIYMNVMTALVSFCVALLPKYGHFAYSCIFELKISLIAEEKNSHIL